MQVQWIFGCGLLVLSGMVSGCGNTASSQELQGRVRQQSAPATAAAPPSSLSTAAPPPTQPIRTAKLEDDQEWDDLDSEPFELPPVEPGTPEWTLREITQLKAVPVDVVRVPIAGSSTEFEAVRMTDAQAKSARMHQASRIIDLAQESQYGLGVLERLV